MKKFVLNAHGKVLDLSSPKIMGVINLNEDSFYSGSRKAKVEDAVSQAEKMLLEGADILDLGVMSTRPGAHMISSEKEIEVLTNVLPELRHLDILFSVDTIYHETARFAIEQGVHIINDISGGRLDPKMWDTVGASSSVYILMHSRGTPATMSKLNSYPEGVVFEVLRELRTLAQGAQKAGIQDLVIDPGFGFAKNPDQNFEMMRQLKSFHILGHPLLVGISRKSMIWKTLNTNPAGALNGTTALNAYALTHYPHILRIHDVKEAKETLKLFEKLNGWGYELA